MSRFDRILYRDDTAVLLIPRIIHQTWKDAHIPDFLVKYQESLQRLHPDFEFRLWTDADNDRLVQEEFPELLNLYRGFARGIHRADFARCLYLLKFGGVYFDLDIEAIKPIGSLLDMSGACAVGCEPTIHARQLRNVERIACNAAMASVPGHPFWREVIAEMERRAKDPDADVNDPVWATGPLCLEQTLEQHGESMGVTVWEPDVFFPLPDLTNHRLGLSPKDKSYYRQMLEFGYWPSPTHGVHHWEHTWINGNRLRQRIKSAARRVLEVRHVIRGKKTIDEVVKPRHYHVDFPERQFPISNERRQQHDTRTDLGKRHAAESRLAIAALIHNRLDLILLLRARLERLAQHFHSAEFFILGEDSDDGTEQALAEWVASTNERVWSVNAPDLSQCKTVYARMSRLRNALLESVQQRAQQTQPFHYLMQLDGDMNGPVSQPGLMHAMCCLAEDENVAAVTAFGVNNWGIVPRQVPYVGYTYYDTLAFRETSFQRCHSDSRIRWKLRRAKRGSPPIDVHSAFGGSAIYRCRAIDGIWYPEHAEECEHVLFHQQLKTRGQRIIVDPSFLLLAGKQGHHHTNQAERPNSLLPNDLPRH